MVVNYVDVALALIIVAYIISGWKRGFRSLRVWFCALLLYQR